MRNSNSDHAILKFKIRAERLEGVAEDLFWFVSKSKAMEPINEMLLYLRRESMKDLAPEPTVFITGESGTGKEGVARMIHVGSRLGKGPWISVNCGYLNEDELSSELFGLAPSPQGKIHKIGLIDVARGGTLFLSEIGKMGLSVQNKLLFFLQTQVFDSNMRIIATSSEDLEANVKSGIFSKELHDLLSIIKLEMPPLRERLDDIIPLSIQLAKVSFSKQGKKFESFTSEAENSLKNYFWPGNISELSNLVERVALLSAQLVVHTEFFPFNNHLNAIKEDLFEPIASNNFINYTDLKKHWSDLFEKTYLSRVLDRNHGNVSAAAREVKLDRSNFLRLLRKHGLKAVGFREAA